MRRRLAASSIIEKWLAPGMTSKSAAGIGLLPGPERTEAGYRDYGEDSVTRLLFLARARGLGISCEQIAELLPAWRGTNCVSARDRRELHRRKAGGDQRAHRRACRLCRAAPKGARHIRRGAGTGLVPNRPQLLLARHCEHRRPAGAFEPPSALTPRVAEGPTTFPGAGELAQNRLPRNL